MIFLCLKFCFIAFCAIMKYSFAFDPVDVVDNVLGTYKTRNVLNLILDTKRGISPDWACPLKYEDFLSYDEPKFQNPVRVYENCRLAAQTISSSLKCSIDDPCNMDSITLTNYLEKPASMDWETVQQLSAHYLGTAAYENSFSNNGNTNVSNPIVLENIFPMKSKLNSDVELKFFVVIGLLKCDIGVRAVVESIDRSNVLSSYGFRGSTAHFEIECEKDNSCSATCKEYKLKEKNIFPDRDDYWNSSNNKECLVDLDFKHIYAASEKLGPCLHLNITDPSIFSEKELTIPLFYPNGTVVKATWTEYYSNS